ncbi:thioredoxin domain-containing protein [Candidatus Peregrinibacteria bacterium]|nr:thioredoxin domain-containing protein [Candidatus Peregrinibacteria bacterium]
MQKIDRRYFYITVGLFGVGVLLGFLIGNSVNVIDEAKKQQILGNESDVEQSPIINTVVKTEFVPQTPGIISPDDDATIGDPNAKVTIIEFSDYECPTCKKSFDTLFIPLEKEYIETGKVLYAFRDFPLEQHKNSLLAAEAAECAGEQNHYYQMHEKLFTTQDEWIGKDRGDLIFRQYAEELKLPLVDDFYVCVKTGAMEGEIALDIADGEKHKVEVTPTYFINGKLYKGIQKYEVLKALIDAELK